jgi:hypothetical protein
MNAALLTFDVDAFMQAMIAAGWEDDIAWAEDLAPPSDAVEFAREVIFVICNSGMKNTVARGIFARVMVALYSGESAATVFGHKGKAAAIDDVWGAREILLVGFLANRNDGERLAWLGTIPWIGRITKYHLAKNFGMQVAKPDVHLQRLAATFKTSPQALCEELATRSGYKVATIDTLLWRGAANGILDTRSGAFTPALNGKDVVR